MSRGGSSERIAFLRREIARIERDGAPAALADTGAGAPSTTRSLAPAGEADALLAPARLAGGLHEIVAARAPDAFAALGLALAICAACGRARPAGGIVLAVEDFVAQETGAPYGPGLAAAGVDPARLVIIRTQGPRETLRAMEEALKSRAVAVVLAETAATAKLYSLDASRRLTLAARAGGAAGLFVPIALAGHAERLSSAAATRLEVSRRSSAIEPVGQAKLGLPGAPVAGVRFLKARGAFEADPARVHEVAFQKVAFREAEYDAFSVDPSPLPADRPDQAAGARIRIA